MFDVRLSKTRLAMALIMLCACVACALFVPAYAAAAESRPLGIAKFTMRTTEPQEVKELVEGATIRRFFNAPAPFTQAGGHPNQLTTTLEFTSQELEKPEPYEPVQGGHHVPVPTRDPKDVVVDLPPGLLGNPTAVPRCQLSVALATGAEKIGRACPVSTQVGVADVIKGGARTVGPIYNVTPEAGQSAEFAIVVAFQINLLLTAHVVSTPPYGYGLAVADNGVPLAGLTSAELTFWGVPDAASHDPMRGLYCSQDTRNFEICFNEGGERGSPPEVPFLTMPSNCAAGPETATVKADSWEEPRVYTTASATLPGPTGCNALQFNAGTEVSPDTLLADAPVGLGVNLAVPQVEEPQRLATPPLRDATVTLPLGMSISPGIVDGIQACEASGPEGIDIPTGLNAEGKPLQPDELGEGEERGLNGEPQLAPGHCPDASTVGTAKATTPLLSEPVEGHVYLAKPGCGGAGQAACTEQDALDGNLYKLYLELGGKGALGNAGVNIKVQGRVQANPATGQLTTRFLENPQLPFSKLDIKLNGGPRAPLDTPAACGPATTTADFRPWSAPGRTPEGVFMAGLPDATPSSFFDVEGCASPPGLRPGFLAQTAESRAGTFAPFTLALSREDREQDLSGIQLHTPPGLLGVLASVPLCGEPQAQQGTCSDASKIGTTTVASGAGSHPFEIGGDVYLTTGYRGAPFGLSIVTHVVAGPFNLGLVVVGARIDVDPSTSALTVTSDPLPQIVFGVPLRLQRITVHIDRPNFMFNPTNCRAQQITASIYGSQDAVANVSSPFAAGDCKSLAFKPGFTVSTSGLTSRVNGASLDTRVSYPKNALGSDANIAKVKVSLPKQLPSRLTTLQKACTAATFDANPASCPKPSIVGIARATTPLLPVALSGPAYFVSHGGEAFPNLIIVLQGDGVRVDLVGDTFISKAGITSTTFNTIPDVPVGTFELYLPQGPYSALAANGNLCAEKLQMPTTFTGQNGAAIEQVTPISVQGCKPAIRVLRHSVSGKHATVVVSVPSAGRLIAGGGGVIRSSRAITKAATVTLTLRLSRSEQRFVAGRRDRRLKVPLELSFTPARGKRLQARVAVLMR